MAQQAFNHAEAVDAAFPAPPTAVLAPTVSLFGGALRLADLAQRCRAGGFAVAATRPLAALVDGSGGVLGDVVVVDCPQIDAADVIALARLDERAMRSGARVIAITAPECLDDVFGCLSHASVQYLVDPRPGDFHLALVRSLPGLQRGRVRELDEADHLALLRLTEEVGRLAAKLDRMALPLGGDGPDAMTGRLASPGSDYRAEGGRDLMRRPRPPLPDPRLIHHIIRQRRLRDHFFEGELFADPAWDMLLDLTAARAEHRRVSVTSLCIAAAVPATTALRWIQQMTDMGLLLRQPDPVDKRRAFITLADDVADAMARYFEELGKDARKTV